MRNPVTGSELTADWLTDALRPQTGGAVVEAVEVEDLLADDSLFSVPVRLHLTWRDGDAWPELPTVLFAKVVSPGDRAAALGSTLGVFEREATFYNELAATCGVQVPRAWLSWAEGDATMLLLEDLSTHRPGDGVAGIDATDAETVLDALGSMHAAWWASPALETLTWLRRDDAETVATMDAGARDLLPVFLARCGADLEVEEVSVLEEVAASASSWRAPLLNSPHATLLHGDVKPGNLFFADGAVTFIDWQGVKVGSPALDVASLLGCGIVGPDRREVSADLLARYEARLSELGVVLDRPRWREELRLAASAMLLPCIASAEVADDRFASTLAVTARRRIGLALSLRQN